MAEDLKGLLAAAGAGAAVGAADQVAIDTAWGQKNAGTTSWIAGSLATALGLAGHFALPKRARGARQLADGLVAGGMTVIGQVGMHDLDRAVDRVAKVSGSLSITTSSSSGSGASSGANNSATSANASSAGATSAGSTAASVLALDSSDLNFGAQ